MPRPRKPENRSLPQRWEIDRGVYYYQVPLADRDRWDGKKKFRLGTTLMEATGVWAARMEARPTAPVSTVDALLDRYLLEVVPRKAPRSQSANAAHIERLKRQFAGTSVNGMKPSMVYQYVSARGALTAAHREIEVLSHAFTKAVQWGLIDRHPFKGEVRFDGELAPKPKRNYVEDWEIVEALALAPFRKKGSVLVCQAYVRLKLVTGLSRSDLLRLRLDTHIKPDGIHSGVRHKTQIMPKIYSYAIVPERKTYVEQALAVRPALSPFLFCNKWGEGYFNEATGLCGGWDSMWANFMDRVVKETKVTRRFTDIDLRRKVGSDAESLERARQLLQHAPGSAITQSVYRVKPEVV